jgi:hypothetical protein
LEILSYAHMSSLVGDVVIDFIGFDQARVRPDFKA